MLRALSLPPFIDGVHEALKVSDKLQFKLKQLALEARSNLNSSQFKPLNS